MHREKAPKKILLLVMINCDLMASYRPLNKVLPPQPSVQSSPGFDPSSLSSLVLPYS